MKSKLTLSLPEKTISTAKQIAKRRRTTVSALFAESLQNWRFETEMEAGIQASTQVDMSDLLGILNPQPAFDARSARIRTKHG